MLVENFLDYLRFERNYSNCTLEAYERDLLQFADFIQVEETEKLADVESGQIREWVVALMDEGYSSTTVNRKLSTLRSFYKFLCRKGRIEIDPMSRITGPKNEKPLPSFLKESEMERLLELSFDGRNEFLKCRDRLIIETFYATGIRSSELIGLNVRDVDFSMLQLKVLGKRGKQRLVPFGEELKSDLLEYLEMRNQLPDVDSEAFFVKEDGKRVYKSLVYNIVRNSISKVSTLKKKSPHVLRHTFATALLNNEASLSVVKELLGHASLATTEVYTHTTFEELKKIYNQAHPRA